MSHSTRTEAWIEVAQSMVERDFLARYSGYFLLSPQEPGELATIEETLNSKISVDPDSGRIRTVSAFLVEAEDSRALSRGMMGLNVRMARALNRVMNRKGQVFADRYDRPTFSGLRRRSDASVRTSSTTRTSTTAPSVRIASPRPPP